MSALALSRQDAGAAPVAGRHAIRRLDLDQFRCYAAVRVVLDGRSVVLTGPNGAGKTNLLEAVSLLAPGRGLRSARLGDIDRIGGTGPWAVAAEVETPAGPVRLGTGRVAEEGGRERRAVRVDGVAQRGQAALSGHLSVIWLTPQMDRLFIDAASTRRRFLDRLVYGLDPDHAGRVAAYEQALRERNRLLREGGDPTWIDAAEDTLARYGIAIAATRRALVDDLDRRAGAPYGPFPGARAALACAVDAWLADMPALAAEDRLRERLRATRRDDAASGTTAAGPHRADLEVRHAGTGMPAALCSTGEQKALLVGLVLAHARLQSDARGAAPLLLLDEVAAHLDAPRREALFDAIEAFGAQAWLTGTDAALFAPLGRKAQHFQVADAHITARDGASE